MNDNNTLGYFYNADVNCNGVTEEQDTGLNQRSIYTDLDYACIIGECFGCITGSPGDGLVKDSSANLNNFYPGLTTNLFYYHAFSLTDIHTALPKQIYQNMQGLDEPNEYPLAYHVDVDTGYTGFLTVQNDTAANDYDDFKFSVPAQCDLTMNISNISISDLMAHIVDSTGATIGTIVHSAGASTIQFMQPLSAGNYYLQIYGKPTTTSYLYPYNFTLTCGSSGIPEMNKNNLLIYPIPATDQVTIEVPQKATIEILNIQGQVIQQQQIQQGKTDMDISELAKGVYILRLFSNDKTEVRRIVKEQYL